VLTALFRHHRLTTHLRLSENMRRKHNMNTTYRACTKEADMVSQPNEILFSQLSSVMLPYAKRGPDDQVM
jgi:hypothetical protein